MEIKKNVSSQIVMQKTRSINLKKWFLFILFTCYVSGISFFTHTHIIGNTVYIHSHPYDKSKEQSKSHTEGELQILHLFYHTNITSDIIPDYDFTDRSQPLQIVHCDVYPDFVPSDNKDKTYLRAPPIL